jgi:hypothetical protein
MDTLDALADAGRSLPWAGSLGQVTWFVGVA